MARSGFESAHHNNNTVLISESSFVNNERGLTLQGALDMVTVQHTVFKDNIAMHAGIKHFIQLFEYPTQNSVKILRI